MRSFARWPIALLATFGSITLVGHAQDDSTPGAEDQLNEIVELIEEIGPAELRELIADELGWAKRETFAHEIGPEADTMQGRLIWMVPRLEGNESYWAAGIAIDLEDLRVRDAEYDDLDKAIEALAEHADLIRLLIDASRLPPVRLGFDGPIPSRSLPQGDPRLGSLGTIRKATRLLLADAVRVWHTGDRDGAVERAAAMIRLARPPETRDDMMMSLIRESILEYSVELVEAMADRGLTADQNALLREAIVSFNAEDPCRIRSDLFAYCAELERFVVGGVRNERVSDDLTFYFSQHLGMVRAMDAFISVFTDAMEGIEHEDPAEAVRAKGMDAIRQQLRETEGMGYEEFLTAARLGSVLLDQAREAWDEPNAKELLEAIDELANAEPTGLTAMMIQAPMGTNRKWTESRDHLARIRAAIEN